MYMQNTCLKFISFPLCETMAIQMLQSRPEFLEHPDDSCTVTQLNIHNRILAIFDEKLEGFG